MNRFNLRVYGLLINDRREVLLSSENRFGRSFVKFPGGGLEYGEGLKEGLKREFQEECGIDLKVNDLFYVNDFAQVSAFNKNDQLFSFYYKVEYPNWEMLEVVDLHHKHTKEGELLVWRSIEDLSTNDLAFPVDKLVAEKIKSEI
jgi:8-oxo-dGTP diphosphatase